MPSYTEKSNDGLPRCECGLPSSECNESPEGLELAPADIDNMVVMWPKDAIPASPKLYRDISRGNPELELLTP